MAAKVKPAGQAAPIAVVGMGCRLPGGLDSPVRLWQGLLERMDAIGEIPPDRFDAASLHRSERPGPGQIASRLGGFLEGIDRFDATFFGISPRESERLDPQQRLLLEASFEALEDAGIPTDSLQGSRAGVFVGIFLSDFEARLFSDPRSVDFYSTTGTGRYAASGRLSFALGLEGPSVTLDTACSSSLVAVHLAVQSLRQGECPVALAGGANVILQPQYSIAYSQSGMIAPDGRCKFGDARGDGYVRSEGAGIVVLKRLEDALADGDRIYAVIRGSAVNNDGRSGDHLATPAQRGQEGMLRLAYQDAGIPPSRVGYVEAHGTGTSTGDPIELGALATVLSEGRPPDRPIWVGSVKTNVGHTEGAAGVAGLMKAALVLHHRVIPPSLHFREPNPNVPWDRGPLVIPQEAMPLPEEASPAVAGVSSFGIAGTNAHVVLTEAPAIGPEAPKVPSGTAVLVPLSARTEPALKEHARRCAAAVGATDAPHIGDIGYTASCRRAHHEERACVLARNGPDLAERLTAYASGELVPGMVRGTRRFEARPSIVFVFPGQGSQWVGMGRRLMEEEPVFRASLEACDAAMKPFVDWSLLEQLAAEEGSPAYRLDQIDVVQPVLVSIDIALAELWRSWGVEPDAVIGHSMGEVAAAHVAGALGLDEAMRVICVRSKLLRRVSGRGAMAVVELSRREAEQEIKGREEDVAVAASNSPRSTILSGDPEVLESILADLERREIFCRPVNVDVASHSPQVDPLRSDLLEALGSLSREPGTVRMYSTVRAEAVDGRELDARYWVDNLRQPVLLAETIEASLADAPETIFIEVSPHPVLQPAIDQTLREGEHNAIAIASVRRHEDERASLLLALGELHVVGYPVDWAKLWPEGAALVGLPGYPWQRDRFWYEPTPRSLARTIPRRSDHGEHPLLGPRTDGADGSWIWELDVSLDSTPFLADHRVGDTVVVPAAAFLGMALAGARQVFGESSHEIRRVAFEEVAAVNGDSVVTLQLVLRSEATGTASFEIFGRERTDASREGEGAGAPPGEPVDWIRHVRGVVYAHAPADGPATDDPAGSEPEEESRPPMALEPGDPLRLDAAEHYDRMAERGLHYGEEFRRVVELSRGNGAVTGRLRPSETAARVAPGSYLGAGLLDGCFQLLLATLEEEEGSHDTLVPVSLDAFRVLDAERAAEAEWAHAVRRHDPDTGLVGDIRLLAEDGRTLASVKGLRFRRLPRREPSIEEWFHEVQWRPCALPEDGSAPSPPVRPGAGWLILADESGLGEQLATRLEAEGATVVLVFAGEDYADLGADRFRAAPGSSEHLRRILDALPEVSLDGAIHLWALDEPGGEDSEVSSLGTASDRISVGALGLARALAALEGADPVRLWLVTRAAQVFDEDDDGGAPAHASLWGLGAVLGSEHPELACTCIDLAPVAEPGDAESLLAEMRGGGIDRRIAWRGGTRFAAVLTRGAPAPARASHEEGRNGGGSAPIFRLEADASGALQSMAFRPESRRPPSRGEVELEVTAAALNFIDVLKAMGAYPGLDPGMPVTLGSECVGRIAAVGEAVDGLQVGDEVVALARSIQATTMMASHVTVPASLVFPKPAGLSAEEAAGVPIAFLTARYSLFEVARLAAGERVLIHAGSGGVGLAAVQLAQRAGAEIFATAGNPEKRDFLRGLGVHHVMDSRTLDFADEILELTSGHGVDVVLNSLAGPALRRSVEVLGRYGRFIELGKRDIYEDSRLGLGDFRRGLSFSAVDLVALIEDRTELVAGLMEGILADLDSGRLDPLPVETFPMSHARDAFLHLAQARHIGKVVVLGGGEPVPVEAAGGSGAITVRPEGTYLVTGGLGALGLLTAEWLVRHGARHLVLAGRSQPSPEASSRIRELEERGVDIRVVRADVSRADDVAGLFEEADQTMPPIRGVVHAAGLLADGTVLQMDVEQFATPMPPKVRGAWNLHRRTSDLPLDFFVLFSSAASILGTPGQANYATANAFMDGLARHRAARGLPALSVNWGPWEGAGLATEADRGGQLAHRGLAGMTPDRALAALGRVLSASTAEPGSGSGRRPGVAIMPFDAGRWTGTLSAGTPDPFFAELLAESSSPTAREASVREALTSLPNAAQRRKLLEAHLREQVARVLRLQPAHVPVDRPLKALGLDSLMALELRNRLEASLELRLSATLVWSYPTLSQLVPFLGEQMGLALAGPGDDPGDDPGDGARPSGRDRETAPPGEATDPGASREDVEAMLESELATADDLLREP